MCSCNDIYSAGLRSGELCSLKVTDIDSERMLVKIRGGKGRKDRTSVMRMQPTLLRKPKRKTKLCERQPLI